VKNTPGSLNESLAALERTSLLARGRRVHARPDRDWLAYKPAKEVDPVALRRIRTILLVLRRLT